MLIYGEVKAGDEVICVDDNADYGKLTLGKTYEIQNIHPFKTKDNEEWIRVQSDRGDWWYYPRHFSLKIEVPVSEGWSL